LTAIRFLYGGKPIRAFAGPGLGTCSYSKARPQGLLSGDFHAGLSIRCDRPCMIDGRRIGKPWLSAPCEHVIVSPQRTALRSWFDKTRRIVLNHTELSGQLWIRATAFRQSGVHSGDGGRRFPGWRPRHRRP
jgi:hypothetical protein